MKRIFFALGLTLLAATGCTTEPSNADKLDLADQYLSEHGGEPTYRAVAYDLYKEVLEGPDDQAQAVRAHFGVGMIGFLDLVQGLPRLLTTDEESDESGSMPPADALAGTIDSIVHEVVDKGIVQHFEVVRQNADFAFTFKTLSFPPTDPTQKPIVLSGEWDLTEINAIFGLLQTVVGAVELIYVYDQVPEAVLTAALSGAEIPEMPSNPSELPLWITETAKLVGLDPLPWLDPAFGKLSDAALLVPIRERFALGFGALETAMQYLQDESDHQSDDVFPKDKFLESILKKLLPGDDLIAGVIGGVIGPNEIEELTGALRASIADDDTVFILPDFLWDLIETAVSKKPNDPIELHMPGVKLSSFFTNPIMDIKDRAAGLLPYYDDKGLFVLESEQEPWVDDNGNELVDDGEFEDIGVDGFVDLDLNGLPDFADRPGKGDGIFNDELGLNDATTLPGLRHKSPHGDVDLDNGIVDPAYLFFGDATFGGAFTPITTGTETTYMADTTKPYTNADLMRLTSSLVWILSDLSF